MKRPAKAPSQSHDHRHCIEDAIAAAEKLCAVKGLRFTPLRRRVLELVWSSHRPVGAYALLDELRNEERGSAPPTVYRALDFLIENGLIHRIERMNAFIGCSHPGESHRGFFLICGECGNAEELQSDGVADTIAASASRRGFVARDMTLEVTGTCAGCRRSA
ncbi:Fur family transcriptional regulator [Reyranella sp.]|uniref:Fur family transcriptional regulator n=1 Tax=Reyranella sp. TaxID=1929291 RepID=UPI002F939583